MDTDGLPALGRLQFKEGTFRAYCVKKYHYANDIWDGEIQEKCADDMIRDGQLWQWGTAKICRKYEM